MKLRATLTLAALLGSVAREAHSEPADTPPGPDEVRVTGRRDPPTAQTINRTEVRLTPGAFGDPFRAIDVSPSLVPTLSGIPYFFIRGAPPSAVGYYVDEVRVPYLFHFALGPGVVHPALVESVTLHADAFPGQYGRYAGGIVSARVREPSSELHGEAQLRLFDAGAFVESSFADGRASAAVGGRYSYTAAIVSLVVPSLTLDYRDYVARTSYAIDDRWRASLLLLGSYDYASQRQLEGEHVYFASEFHRIDLRLDRTGGDGATSRIAATVGFDRTRLDGARFSQDVVTGVRGRHRFRPAENVELEVGADFTADFYRADLPSPYAVSREDYDKAEAFFAPREETATGAWASLTLQPRPGWLFTGTARGDIFTSAGEIAIGPSPRLSARIPLVPRAAFLAALGIAPQPPAFAIPVPAVGYHGLPGGLAYAYQKSAGVEIALPLRFTLRTVAFHHSYANLRTPSRDESGPDAPTPPPAALAQAVGVETFLSRRLAEHFSAYASVTLSRSQTGSTSTHPSRASEWDRPYVVQAGGAVDFGRGWRASGRFLTYGGWPYYGDNARASGLPPPPAVDERLPGFSRVDVRVEKRWTFPNERWLAVVLEGLNVTASKEVTSRHCYAPNQRGPGAAGGCEDELFGPVAVPSLGVEGGL